MPEKTGFLRVRAFFHKQSDEEEKYPEARPSESERRWKVRGRIGGKNPSEPKLKAPEAQVGAAGAAARYPGQSLFELIKKQIRWHHGARPSS